MAVDQAKIRKAVRDILEASGEDPDREGLVGTPDRVARMYEEIFCGLHQDPREHLKVLFADEKHEEMVVVKDGRLTGLSKLARVIETIAKRPQLQERITKDTANIIMEELRPYGVMVVVEAEHMCMTMRGVKKPGSKTVTSAVRGVFESDALARSEAMALINL